MADAVAASKTNQAAAAASASDSSNNAIPPAKLVDPQLLMAARRGDSKRIKELLRLNTDGNSTGSNNGVVVGESAAPDAVILDVAPAAPAATPPPPVDDGEVTLEGDTLLHVVAACGDGDDFIDCAKMIVGNKKHKKGGGGGDHEVRLALEARNRKGDTPLHCAAAAGNANMIRCLIDLMNEAEKKALVRTQNECGETALHHAIRAARNKVICIDQLMAVDPELACIPHEDGASPLYVAISLGEIEIAQHLYVRSEGKLSYSGPDGSNVLHAAVYRGQALPMILEWLQDKKLEEGGSLVSRLTSQRDRKHKGSTPLHLAVSLAGWPDGELLSRRFPQVWAESAAASRLLNANESMAYQADDEGSYPIHVAALSNSDAVTVLLERCPDCATLRDADGRTFLHVAAMEGHHAMVQAVVCGQIVPQQLASSWMTTIILNAQDSNGNTALHYAVRFENLAVFNCLLRSREVRLDVANKHGLTPLDLSWTMIPAGINYGLNPTSIVRTSLLAAGAPYGGGRPELFIEKHLPPENPHYESKKYTEASQVRSIVTALIATVTFASAFTLPGGYRTADDKAGAAGTPVLAGSYAFDAFIIADTLAFICSIAATYFLVYVGHPGVDISVRFRYFTVSAGLMHSATRSLVAAFGLGLYLVVHHTSSAIAACAIVFASSIYGNIQVWRVIRMAITVLARIGIRRYAVFNYVKWIFLTVLRHFWSYLVIFGLPAIRKRVH